MISPDTDGFRAKADAGIKRALSGLRYTVPIGLEVTDIPAALARLRTLLRTGNVADFLDVNIPTGRLITQIQMIRRLLRQGGVSDLLEVNLDKASLTKAMAAIKSVSATIPVNFDLSNMPVVGPIGSLTEHIQAKWDIPRLKPLADAAARGVAEHIPVMFDVGALPVTGAVSSLTEHIQAKWDIPPLKPLADVAARGVSERIPVHFDVGRLPPMPVSGATENIGVSVTGITSATAALATLAAAERAASAQAAALDAEMGLQAMRAKAAAATLANMGSDLLKLDTALKDTAGIYAELAAADQVLAAGTELQSAMFTKEAAAVGLNALAFRALNPAAAAFGAAAGKGSGGLAGLNAGFTTGGGAIGVWGGKLTATIPVLGLVIKSVSLWHIILDLVIEALISVGLAAAAAATGIAAMAPAAHNLFDWLSSVHTVSSALGQVISPMTGQFQQLAKAMAPQVIEAFGGALNLVTGKTSGLAQIAARVVTLFDDWIAKIDLWAAGQGGMNKLLSSGIGYLSQFGSIFANLGKALANLLVNDPGIARFLLDFIGGAAKLLDLITMLPGPILAAGFALHGIYLWGSVLVPLIIRLGNYFATLGKTMLGLAVNPFFWVAAAAVAIAYLATQMGRADGAARSFVSGLDAQLANDTASQAILQIAADIGILTAAANAAGSSQGLAQIRSQWSSLGNTAQSFDADLQASGHAWLHYFDTLGSSFTSFPGWVHSMEALGGALKSIFVPGGGAAVVAANNVKAFDAEITKLIAQQGNLFLTAGKLVTQGYTLAQSFALMDLAGVKAGDKLDLMAQKVSNLTTGYEAMSIQGAVLSNSVNAVTFATLQQDSKITTLTGAWTTFISMVTGGQAAFSTFQQQIGTISSQLSGVAPAAIKGATSLGGLSAASLQASASFTTGVTDANSLINALTLQASASGLASKGTDMLTAATKDTVAQLLPMAGSSKAAQAALIALAQQGGFPAGGSFQQLGKWVGTASGTMASAGKSGGPAAQLNSIMGTLAGTSNNLTTDVKNLSIALGTTLTQAESQAILLAHGGVKPFNDFASAIANTGVNSDTTKQAAIKLGDEFLALAHNNVPAAKKEFESFAIGGLGLTKQQADQLWNDVTAHGIPALRNAGGAADTLKNSHLAPLGAGVDTVAGKVRNLSGYLLAVPKSINSTVRVNFVGSGSGSIAFRESIPGVTTGPSSTGLLGFHAAGGFISGGVPGRDSVAAMLMPGEVVVPTSMVQKGAVDHLRGKLPGFANGGSVSSTGMGGLTSMLGRGTPFMQNTEEAFGKAAEGAFAGAVIASFDRKVKAAAAKAAAGSNVKYNPGAGVQQWRGVTQQALGLAGSNVAQLTDPVLYQMQTESAGNPTIVNRTDSNWLAGHPCLTLDSMILTRRGWLTWDDVQVGDETIGYNPQAQRSEWTPVTGVHYYNDAEVWRIGNKHWHADATPNHRWWSDTWAVLSPENLTECPECGWAGRIDRPGLAPATPRSISTHRGRMHKTKTEPAVSSRGEFVLTQDLGHGHRIRLAAPADTDGIPGLSLDDVRVIAWLQGDGHISRVLAKPVICPECTWHPGNSRKNRNPAQPANSVAVHRAKKHGSGKGVTQGEPAGWDGSIFQSKPAQVVKLQALLVNVPHTQGTRERGGNTMPAHQFRLRREYVTDLMKRSRLAETGPEAFVLALSPDQRAAWLDSMIDAEGNRQTATPASGVSRGAHGEFVRISQVDGPLQEAIKLAVYLEGYRPTYSRLARNKPQHQPAGHIGMARSHIAPSMFAPHQVLERQPVWCVTTGLGTWTAEQNGLPFLTGNSVGLMQVIAGTFAAYAGRFRNTGPFEYGVSVNPLANIYSAIKYAQAAYGPGLRNAYGGIGTGRGYAGGGRVPGYADGGRVPGYAGGGTAASAAVAAMRAKIVRQQSYEQADYRGLGDAFTHGPAKYRTKTVMSELGTIVREQAAEQAAYRKLAGTGLNASNLAHLRGAALAERATAGDKALNALPGGHPGWAGDMRNWLGKLAVPGSITPAMAAAIKAAAAAAAAGVPATHTYGGDAGPVVNDIGAFLHSSSVGALGAARGMKVPSFDRGGTLTPGMNLAWNGLGRNESLVPAGSSSTCITLEVAPGGGTAFDQFMTSWLRKHVHIKGAGSITRAFNEH